jgi:hypothetical protein
MGHPWLIAMLPVAMIVGALTVALAMVTAE